jgi:hypothetical protein
MQNGINCNLTHNHMQPIFMMMALIFCELDLSINENDRSKAVPQALIESAFL